DIPRSKYLFFAACNRFQSAKESFFGGGLFTENLIQTLEKSKKDISYADLLIKLRQGVVKMKWDQDPQLEIVGDINSYTQFLDGTQSNETPKYALSFTDEEWILDAGQIMGINEEVKLSILSDQSNQVLGNGKVTKSSAQKSVISSTVTLKPDEKYWAIPLNLPGIPFETGLNSDEPNVQKFKLISERLLNVRFHSPSEQDDQYVIDERGDYFELTIKEKNEVILKSKINIEQATVELVNKLDQIGLWTRFFRLQNNKSGLNPSCCSMSIDIMNTSDQFENFQPGEINLKNDGSRIPYRLWIQNQFTQPLHFALIYLSDHFGAIPLKNEPLEKSESPTLFWGGTENDVFMIPDGSTSSSDAFLIIISTERTDDFQFSLEEIEFGEIKVDMRAIPGMNKNTKFKGEWFTRRFVINLDR
ncbi:MAG: hypothetical protein ABIR66_12885, partial [Saprospiraceae bacterium]